jgi:asparagine synthase (glutamine-hydrolysing)
MCGILGIMPSAEKGAFQRALDKIEHRGPDGFGFWEDSAYRISLGHRRLSILDLTDNAKQPMSWHDRYVITFNGEIYNYIELKKGLEQKGLKFRSQSDTEVLLALYAEEGPACLQKLNGMWALAIFDKQDGSLFISRDRMGKKPFFYINDGKRFAFASEMKALYGFLKEVQPNRQLIEGIKHNMFCYESTSKCLIEGISRFPAASYAYFRNGKLDVFKFWDPMESLIDVPKSYNAQVEMFRELFIDACKIRMRSDVPIGTALSGGVDSSATISTMAYIARELKGDFTKDWQHGFVASFPGSSVDETKEAKLVADNINVGATYLTVDPLKDIENIFYYSYLFEEFYITSPIPFIQLYRKIKESGTTVTLDGHGSDELFGGYSFDLEPKKFDDYPNPLKIWETLQTIADSSDSGIKISPGRVFLEYKNISKRKFLKSTDKNLNRGIKHLDNLNQQLYKSSFETILPTLLRNYDRYSMINGVEIRMPFLDHRIVSFAFSIPSSSKVRDGYTKAIVRDGMRGFIPDKIRLLKRKIGFSSPFNEWIRGPLKPWLMEEINSQEFNSASFIKSKEVKANFLAAMKNDHLTPLEGEAIWSSFMPYVWEKSLKYAV